MICDWNYNSLGPAFDIIMAAESIETTLWFSMSFAHALGCLDVSDVIAAHVDIMMAGTDLMLAQSSKKSPSTPMASF